MTSKRARILILTYTPFALEPRALKQVRYLRDEYAVTTAGFGAAPFDDVPHVEIPDSYSTRWGLFGRLLALGFLVIRWHWPLAKISKIDRVTRKLVGDQDWDVVIAHDLKALDAALSLEPKFGVVLDLHEYAPRQNEHSLLWRLLVAPYFRWMCRHTVPKSAAIVTVSQGIVEEYRRLYGFDSTLVVNATPYYDLPTKPVDAPIRLVHSGGVAIQRRLDLMIEGVRKSKANVTLDLYLMGGESALMTRLRDLAAGEPRIRFRDPVPYQELIQTLNQYDLGLSIFPPTTFNLAWCLPNKFFDFVQARLGVIVGPSPEMARFVDEYKIGQVLPDFEATSLAAALDSITVEQVASWKAASAAHAKALSSESQAVIWEDLIGGLISQRAAGN